MTTLQNGREDEILKRIVQRYAGEIAGNFKLQPYRFAREIIQFWFARLLNATRVKIGAIFRNQYTLRDKIQIVGKVKQLRNLAKKGTIVMVPTHSSNLDSILIGWVIHALGLPAFIYGAGLNLFNIKIIAYFMNSLGAYKVDRRKKNLPYLETLKMYSGLALKRCAQPFLSGGNRSRPVTLKMLKLDCFQPPPKLSENIYLKTPEGQEPRKIFVVPVTLNYHFVLEAPELIDDYLSIKGQDRYLPEDDKYGSVQLIQFLFKFFTRGFQHFGIDRPWAWHHGQLCWRGRQQSWCPGSHHWHAIISSNGQITIDKQREDEYTRMLSQRIVAEYHKIHRIVCQSSGCIRSFWDGRSNIRNSTCSALRLPEELSLDYPEFRKHVSACENKSIISKRRKG